MKHLTVLFVAAIIFSCAKTTLVQTPTNTDQAQTKSNVSTEAELLEGKKLYETNCGSCHELKHPNSQTKEGWKHEVFDMSKKVNREAGKEVLDAKKQAIILNYLLTASNQK